MPDFDEPELVDIANNVIRKLKTMSDEDFSVLDFSPEYFDDDAEV